jgi:hypothetical protein
VGVFRLTVVDVSWSPSQIGPVVTGLSHEGVIRLGDVLDLVLLNSREFLHTSATGTAVVVPVPLRGVAQQGNHPLRLRLQHGGDGTAFFGREHHLPTVVTAADRDANYRSQPCPERRGERTEDHDDVASLVLPDVAGDDYPERQQCAHSGVATDDGPDPL